MKVFTFHPYKRTKPGYTDSHGAIPGKSVGGGTSPRLPTLPIMFSVKKFMR